MRQLPSLSDLLNFTMDPSLSQSSSCSLSSLPRGAGGLLPRLLRRVSGKGERVRRGLEVITCAVDGHRRSKVNNRGKFVCDQRRRLWSSNHWHRGCCRPCCRSELENPKLREGGSIEVACKRDRRNGGGRRVRGREPRVADAGVSGEESLEEQWDKRLRYVMLGMNEIEEGRWDQFKLYLQVQDDESWGVSYEEFEEVESTPQVAIEVDCQVEESNREVRATETIGRRMSI